MIVPSLLLRGGGGCVEFGSLGSLVACSMTKALALPKGFADFYGLFVAHVTDDEAGCCKLARRLVVSCHTPKPGEQVLGG